MQDLLKVIRTQFGGTFRSREKGLIQKPNFGKKSERALQILHFAKKTYTGKKLPRDYFATNEKGPRWYYPTEDFWLYNSQVSKNDLKS